MIKINEDYLESLNRSNKIILSLLADWRIITINKSEGTIIEERKSKLNGKDRICAFDITKKVYNMERLEDSPKVPYTFGIVLSKIFKSKVDDKCVNFLEQCESYIKIINL